MLSSQAYAKHSFSDNSDLTDHHKITKHSFNLLFQIGKKSKLYPQKPIRLKWAYALFFVFIFNNTMSAQITGTNNTFAEGRWADSQKISKNIHLQSDVTTSASKRQINIKLNATSSASLIYALRGGDTNAFWSYNISGNSWINLANTPQPIKIASGLTFAEGDIYAMRGNKLKDFWKYNISGNTWSILTDFPGAPDKSGSLEYDGNGNLYGIDGGNSILYKYNIASNSWSVTTGLPGGVKFDAGASLISDGKNIYAFQGKGTTNFYRYNAVADTWTTMAGTSWEY